MSGINRGSLNLKDVDGDQLDIETRTRSIKAIDVEHGKIHDSVHYFSQDFITLGNGATYQFILVIPATTPKIHLDWEIDFELESTVELKEAVITSGDGTPITLFNSDRNSSNTSSAALYHTPTSPVGGTTIRRGRKGDGQKIGGLFRPQFENIAKSNAKYLLEVTNHGATGSLTNYVFNLYEEA